MRKWCFLWLIVTLAACDSSRVFEEFRDLDTFWLAEETSTFVFEIEDASVSYNLVAHIRNDISYPYRNLYLNFILRSGADSVLKEELKQVQLFEAKSGEPFGSGIGDQFNNEFLLEEEIKFSSGGAYEVDLQQFMRVDSLKGIQRIGLRVEKAEQ